MKLFLEWEFEKDLDALKVASQNWDAIDRALKFGIPMTINQARAALQCPPHPDDRGDKSILEADEVRPDDSTEPANYDKDLKDARSLKTAEALKKGG